MGAAQTPGGCATGAANSLDRILSDPLISEAFALTVGYLSSIGHEHLSSHTGYLGAVFGIR